MAQDPGAVRFAPGAVVARRYRIVRFLGLGGMGEVYEAEDLELGDPVALKTVRHEIADSPRAIERFRREIQLSRKVTHPNVCRMFDLGRDAAYDVTFLTMELVRGETLAERIRRDGRMKPEAALPLIRQMAAGLDAAHAAGVVHRDFKSANVMLVGEGAESRVVITDFGLAARLRPVDTNATATATLSGGSLVGSPAYMAPEQVEGGEVAAAADLYAMGIVVFEMVTGTLPFTGETSLAIAVRRLREAPPPARAAAPEVDARWDAAIRRAMDRDARKRFPNAAAFVAALEGRGPVGGARAMRFALAAAGAGVLLAAAIWGARWLALRRPPAAAAPPEAPVLAQVVPRKAITVLPLGNAAGRADTAWLSTALAEMLSTELGAGGAFRAVPGETVARVRRELRLEDSGALAADTLAKLREGTGADLVVSGAYAAPGGEGNPIRLDLRLQDGATGDTVAAFAETGSAAQLFDLVARTGAKLRAALGASVLSESDASAVRAATPSDPVAARLYAEGLAKLRAYDTSAARDLLERAIALEPGQAMLHGAIAQAWSRLGYDAKAAEEGKRAVELSSGLSREARLVLEAQYADARNDRAKAVDRYAALFAFFPDNVEYGLNLAAAQWGAGKNDDALRTVAALRGLPPPVRDDPRLDIAEARSRSARGESAAALDLARRAAAKAERSGSSLIVAGALALEASALLEQGKPDEARRVAERARTMYEGVGDRQGAARAILVCARAASNAGNFKESLRLLDEALAASREIGDRKSEAGILEQAASSYYDAGDLRNAKERYEQAIAINRETGSRASLASAVGNLANVLDNEGDLDGALRLHQEATELFREVGNRGGVARSQHNVALVRAEKGDLAGAQRDLEEAIAAKRELGHKRSVAFSLSSLGDVLTARGDLRGARAKLSEAVAIREELGEKATAADAKLSLALVDIEEGKFAEAARSAAEQAALFRSESMAEDESGAQSTLALALLGLGRLPEAEAAAAEARRLSAKTLYRSVAITASIASARVDGAAGRRAQALRTLDAVEAEAARFGLVAYQLEARLARAALDPSVRPALERDAAARGFVLIARKCAALK